jgi:hypothetical protein
LLQRFSFEVSDFQVFIVEGINTGIYNSGGAYSQPFRSGGTINRGIRTKVGQILLIEFKMLSIFAMYGVRNIYGRMMS